MRLRTRLFLWIGVIFFLAFGVSLAFEIYSTNKNLEEAEVVLREQILALNEKQREHIEKFLHVSLSEDQAQIDALLLRLGRDPNFAATLFLDPPNLKLVAPAHSAYLFKNDRWIDLIQTTKNQELTSLLIPVDFPMEHSYQAPIDEKLSWVVFGNDREVEHPFIGVRLALTAPNEQSLSFMVDELIETKWEILVLFNPEALSSLTFKAPEETRTMYGINFSTFLSSVEYAEQYLKKLKEKDGASGWVKRAIEKLGQGELFKGKPFDPGKECLVEAGEVLNQRTVRLLQRGDQSILLAALASLFHGGEFGASPFAPTAPKGISRFIPGSNSGHALLTDEAFFQKRVFNDASYLKAHPGNEQCKEIGSSVAVIAPENLHRIFIGNSLHLQGEGAEGYLTVAVDADQMVQDLVLSVHKSAFLVHGGEVISAFDAEGNPVPDPQKAAPFEGKMLSKKSGIVNWDGVDYFFQQMVPFKDLDLHFFVLTTEKEAFALVRSIEEGSREVIKKVSLDMRFIALVALFLVLLLLHNVAKKISKPISSLAQVTEHVAAGRLEDLELPKPPKGKRDEIAILCRSFAEMVDGLREREKVKGILNKVVSPEIAQEIMKGQVHLGGEERKVTVLFADIRNFTNMTASKGPQEVIEMLNMCMTKISHVIDEFGGVIDKYVGDEVMALFGAPLEKEDSALKAVQSALKMVEVLNEWNKERTQNGEEPVEMGIGIHTGVMLAGNMGAENRLNYTVLGSNVNLAARLCSAAGKMEVLISQETLSEPHVQDRIEVEELPPTELKGFEESFVLYRVKRGKDVR